MYDLQPGILIKVTSKQCQELKQTEPNISCTHVKSTLLFDHAIVNVSVIIHIIDRLRKSLCLNVSRLRYSIGITIYGRAKSKKK